jgi:flagellar hook-associated protein 3 FlgL
MRVSTSMQYYSGKQNLLDNQGNLQKLQNQLSTGRKVLNPSDDPVAATRSLLIEQSISKNEQFMASQEMAGSQLALTDSLLNSSTDVLMTVSDVAVAGGDATYTDAERSTLAKELRERLKNLVDLANSKSASGDYVFGGYMSNDPPFTMDPNTLDVTYNGDGGNLLLQIASTATVPITEDGRDVFMRVLDSGNSPTGNSVFGAVKDMIDYLETPNAPTAAGQANYSAALGSLQLSMDHVSRWRSVVGARENLVDTMSETSKALDTQFATQQSALTDLDYTSAITDFTLQKTQLEAAQQSFSKVTESNLFSYI